MADTELVEVTQADRDRAAEYLRKAGIEIGQITLHWTATAFARHRQAAVEAERERCAKLAAEQYADRGWNSLYRNAGTTIASAIRQTGEQTR